MTAQLETLNYQRQDIQSAIDAHKTISTAGLYVRGLERELMIIDEEIKALKWGMR